MTPDHIAVLWTSNTTDISACGRSNSLCAVWVCHWKDGYSYVFSRWISRYILPFHSGRLHFCQSHCTHQIQITHGGAASYPPPPPKRCSSAIIGGPQSSSELLNPCRYTSIPSALLSLNWCFDVSFSAPYCLFCPCSSSRMGSPQSPPQPRLEAPWFHSRLFISLPVLFCSPWMGYSAWMGCSAA